MSALLKLAFDRTRSKSGAPKANNGTQAQQPVSLVGLHSTLTEAVHDILHLSEDEPYGVRGATIILKMAASLPQLSQLQQAQQAQAGGKAREIQTGLNETTLGVIDVDNNTVILKHVFLKGFNSNTVLPCPASKSEESGTSSIH